jgi:enoyl-CoA hydratase/carnithine racemase
MSSDLAFEMDGHVAIVEMRRPPHNFFDAALIRDIADLLERVDRDPQARAVVLAAEGRSFCAGANFGAPREGAQGSAGGQLYAEALRIFAAAKPIVAAVHGPAIGGGLGLALAADFRVTCAEARFAANFTRLGFHPGFGLTVTLPELVGRNAAELMLLTGRRIGGDEAVRIGLANVLVEASKVREAAIDLAREIAECGPLAVVATRATMRAGLVERVAAATRHELAEQTRLRATHDFAEGVKSVAERRPARFLGR